MRQLRWRDRIEARDTTVTEPDVIDVAVTSTAPPTSAPSADTSVTEPTETAVPSTGRATSSAVESTVAPTGCDAALGLTESTMEVGLSTYGVEVFVPTAARELDSVPTLLVFHGGGGTGPSTAEVDGFRELAETQGFAVVHPTADPSWAVWEIEDADHPERDDLAFASQLIDTLITDWCADPTRIYSVGMSIGGTFSARLACELPEQVAGVGSIAQIGVAPQLCDPPLPTPVIQFNGTADPVIPFTGNGESIAEGPESWRWMIETNVPEAFAAGATRRGCDSTPQVASIGGNVIEHRYVGCDGDVEMLLYEITDGGHEWPGAGNSAADISATRATWEFLSGYQCVGTAPEE